MPQSEHGSADDLARALVDAIRAALATIPPSQHDIDILPARLAVALAPRLAAAATAAGAQLPALAHALVGDSSAGGEARGGSIEDRVLAALRRHTAGRSPGVTPDSLASLTGLPQSVLAPAVSALVQAGDLVRDAWLLRLPAAEDLLSGERPDPDRRTTELRHTAERRAIGDRRATGERRLFDRRHLHDG
jgi:hypothetical protein